MSGLRSIVIGKFLAAAYCPSLLAADAYCIVRQIELTFDLSPSACRSISDESSFHVKLVWSGIQTPSLPWCAPGMGSPG